jgi:hypothetical protein
MDHSMDYLQDTREEEAQGPAPTFGLSRDSPAPPADMHLLRQSGKGASLDRCAPPNPLHGAPLPCATFHERARDFTRDAALSPSPALRSYGRSLNCWDAMESETLMREMYCHEVCFHHHPALQKPVTARQGGRDVVREGRARCRGAPPTSIARRPAHIVGEVVLFEQNAHSWSGRTLAPILQPT